MNEPEGDVPPPQHEGEDTTPTTTQELRGWYSYGMAAEIFAVCGVGSFLPVTLEQLAREVGVLWSDKTTTCKDAVSNLRVARSLGVSVIKRDDHQCIIRPFGHDMTTSSFSLYTFSIATLVQAITLVSFGSFADHGNYRKRLLLSFAFTGAVSSMLFIFVVPELYLLATLLVIVGVTCLGSSFVTLNSFLPLLSRHHPSLDNPATKSEQRSLTGDGLSSSPDTYEISPPVADSEQPRKRLQSTTRLQVSNTISARGVGLGYCAAVTVQCLSIAILYTVGKIGQGKSSPTLPLRLVLLLVGICWAGGTIPAYVWLRDRPGPPLPHSSRGKTNSIYASLEHISFAWKALWKTIKTACKLHDLRIFFSAWFLLSDSIATVSGTAILFARTELHLGTMAIALLSITATSSGIVGALAWPRIARHFQLPTNRVIIACICLMELIPLYGLLGYIPFIKAWGTGGLQRAWEIYPLAFIHGLVMGGLSSYCRSFMGQLIPPRHEAAFYALYAVTDKGSSAVGPAIVGAIVDRTGQIRAAFGFLAVLVVLPAPLIWLVDAERGRKDAVAISETLGQGGNGDYQLDDRIAGHANANEESQGLLREPA